MLIQSLSIRAVSGWALALNTLAGPQTSSREPWGLVRKRNGVFQVMIPSPNWLLIQSFQIDPDWSNAKSMPPGPIPPFQFAVNATGFLIHQPVWLAIVSGRQR